MAADTTSLHLRLPKKLYKKLQQQAKRNNVSLNTEIVNQLEGYESATIKRATETMQPLLREAVHAAAATALLLGTARVRTEEELIDVLERLDTPKEFASEVLAAFRKREAAKAGERFSGVPHVIASKDHGKK